MPNIEEKVALCLVCRKEFTEEETKTATCCPNCKSTSVPADPREKATITLTYHELRILCIWASNWAIKTGEVKNNIVIESIINNIHQQDDKIPALSLREEFTGILKEFPDTKIVDNTGKETFTSKMIH